MRFCLFILALFLFLIPSGIRADFLVQMPQQEKGIGLWHEIPFGKMRLISCTSGVKNSPLIVGGLQIELSPGWILKKPILKPLSDQFPFQTNTPVRMGDGRNVTYQDKVFFPLTYAHPPEDQNDFIFGTQGTLTACKENNCLNLPIKIELALSAKEADYTSMCAYIISQQSRMPLDAKYAGISGLAKTDASGIHLQVVGLTNVQRAFLQTESEESFQVKEVQLNNKDIRFLLTQTPAWEIDAFKTWILVTDKGVYRVPFKMQSQDFSPPQETPTWDFWLIGLEWFFLSSLFVWWGLSTPKTTPLLKQSIKKLLLGLCLIYPLTIIGTYMEYETILFTSTGISFYLFLMVFIGMCFLPFLGWKSALILFTLSPHPFLWNIPWKTYSSNLIFLWSVITFLELILPLIILYLRANIFGKILHQEMKNHYYQITCTFLLPAFGLLIWLGCIHLQSIPKSTSNIQQKGLVIVCKQTDIDCHKWQDFPNQSIQILSENSTSGKSLKEKYHRFMDTLVIWHNDKTTFVLPTNTSPQKAQQFIFDVNKYHASDMP